MLAKHSQRNITLYISLLPGIGCPRSHDERGELVLVCRDCYGHQAAQRWGYFWCIRHLPAIEGKAGDVFRRNQNLLVKIPRGAEYWLDDDWLKIAKPNTLCPRCGDELVGMERYCFTCEVFWGI